MGSAIPELVVPGFVRKRVEQVNRQHPSMASESAPASKFPPGFLPCLPSVDCDSEYISQINAFLPKLLLVMVIHC